MKHLMQRTSILSIMAIMAIIGVATAAIVWYLLLVSQGVESWLATTVGILTFIGLAAPIPFHLLTTWKMFRQATIDPLSGLLNRESFNIRLKELLSRPNQRFYVLILDLNKFKLVNDTLGHHAGDQLLQSIALRLREAVHNEDVVARLGGDEFAILVSDAENNKSYEPVIARIIKAISEPVLIEERFLYASVSIGVATYPDSATTAVNLMRFADIAMYSAKKMQKDFCVYQDQDDTVTISDLSLLGEIRKGVENNEFILWFQPKKSLLTNSITSVECLIRWNHPTRGLLGPDAFIPFAEESGMIKYLTQFVIKQTAQSYKLLREAGYDLDMSVNVSPNDVVDPSTMTTIIKSIVKADMSPEKFVLEVTETAIMHDPDSAFKVLVALESLGIKLSIDDFGTGHSSMTYLKNFPIHEVKIDQSFVRDLESNEQAYSIVKSTIELSHSLGATTVGEGVETKRVEEILGVLNCDYVQGYYIARPMPIDQLIIWLNTYYSHKDKLLNA